MLLSVHLFSMMGKYFNIIFTNISSCSAFNFLVGEVSIGMVGAEIAAIVCRRLLIIMNKFRNFSNFVGKQMKLVHSNCKFADRVIWFTEIRNAFSNRTTLSSNRFEWTHILLEQVFVRTILCEKYCVSKACGCAVNCVWLWKFNRAVDANVVSVCAWQHAEHRISAVIH